MRFWFVHVFCVHRSQLHLESSAVVNCPDRTHDSKPTLENLDTNRWIRSARAEKSPTPNWFVCLVLFRVTEVTESRAAQISWGISRHFSSAGWFGILSSVSLFNPVILSQSVVPVTSLEGGGILMARTLTSSSPSSLRNWVLPPVFLLFSPQRRVFCWGTLRLSSGPWSTVMTASASCQDTTEQRSCRRAAHAGECVCACKLNCNALLI